MADHPKESVLVLPARVVNKACADKFTRCDPKMFEQLMKHFTFMDREAAELDPNWKQVIPYVLVSSGELFLVSQRTNKQAEKRLHNKFSIGQGGHVNEEDYEQHMKGGAKSAMVVAQALYSGMKRELREEFGLDAGDDLIPMGLINDNSNDVGRVHLGILYHAQFDTTDFEVKETGKHIARFLTREDIKETVYDRLEGWSAIVYDSYVTMLQRVKPLTVGVAGMEQILDRGCLDPECKIKHHEEGLKEIYIHAACHKEAGVWVRYERGTGVLNIMCSKCGRRVLDVAVALIPPERPDKQL